MYIIVEKKSGSNAWDYPDKPKYFKQSFVNRDDPEKKQLICLNESGKSLEELTNQAGYPILEYIGVIPDMGNYRTVVSAGELLLLIGETAYTSIFEQAIKFFDSEAAFFLESTIGHPVNDLIDIADIESVLNSFAAKGFITSEDLGRILKGVEE